MAELDRRYGQGTAAGRAEAVVDQGLRAYMLRVYNYMAGGVALTGIVAWFTYQAAGGSAIHVSEQGISGLTGFGQALFSMPATLIMFIGLLGFVFLINGMISRVQTGTAVMLFLAFAALFGLVLSSIFITYTGASITQVFFISAASFGALSLYGYTTQRDLTPIGSFLIMGLFGIIIAMIVNWFLASGALGFAISVIGVLIFAGLTAYDTQRIKEMYSVNDDGTVTGRKAVMGALSLYLDFINLFMFLLSLLGDRR
jgi:FtsH-binding integral membrane protein